MKLKNGTIKVAEDSEECLMLIQNYCDLTLEDLTLIGSDVTRYLISSNYGDVVLATSTSVEAARTSSLRLI